MLLPAVVGWVMGLAWRADLLPGVSAAWRVPAWVVGEKERRRVVSNNNRNDNSGSERYEDLRRRLEGEAAAAAAASTGVAGEGASDQGQRHRRSGGFLERLRGAL